VSRGSLTVVGTGIRAGVQLTAEARSAIEHADVVLFLVADPVAAEALRRLNPAAESLADLYRPGVDRDVTYAQMVERIVARVRDGLHVVAAFYGHPGVFGRPGHAAVELARAEGFGAEMLPGISAEACLFADLGIDPGDSGCQSYEATLFLWRRPAVDTGAVLVLWQVGLVGRTDTITEADLSQLPELTRLLLELYPPEHEAICYEGSPYPVGEPYVHRFPISALATEQLPVMSTLVVRPAQPAAAPAASSSSSDRTDAAATTLPLAE
jgi:siroheme synthase